jgi:hypothetical protein
MKSLFDDSDPGVDLRAGGPSYEELHIPQETGAVGRLEICQMIWSVLQSKST